MLCGAVEELAEIEVATDSARAGGQLTCVVGGDGSVSVEVGGEVGFAGEGVSAGDDVQDDGGAAGRGCVVGEVGGAVIAVAAAGECGAGEAGDGRVRAQDLAGAGVVGAHTRDDGVEGVGGESDVGGVGGDRQFGQSVVEGFGGDFLTGLGGFACVAGGVGVVFGDDGGDDVAYAGA